MKPMEVNINNQTMPHSECVHMQKKSFDKKCYLREGPLVLLLSEDATGHNELT